MPMYNLLEDVSNYSETTGSLWIYSKDEATNLNNYIANTNNANSYNIIFTIKETKLYVPVVTLSAKDNQKLSKLVRKGFKKSVYWNEYKTKRKKKKYRYFLESNFVGGNRLFVLIYLNQDDNAKRYKAQRYYLPKGIIKNYSIIINGKNLYDQPIDFDIKRYEDIRKLTIRQGENYTTGCSWDYDYIKNHNRLIAIDLSRQKGLDADPKQLSK